MMVHVNSFDTKTYAERGVEMTVRLPDGTAAQAEDGTPVVITLAGSDSDVYHRAVRDQRDRLLEQQATQGGAQPSAEEQMEVWIEVLVSCTLAWRGLADDTGPLGCTPENARLLYGQYPVIREQVDAFITDRRNFLHS